MGKSRLKQLFGSKWNLFEMNDQELLHSLQISAAF